MSEIKVEYLGGFGSDVTVVNAARVSFAKEAKEIGEGDERLIRYLATHKHHSPFNHAFLSFRVKAPIFVARQLVKHKFMPWNEVSRRYVDEEPEFYFPEYWRGRAENVKQGSSEEAVDIVDRFEHFSGQVQDYDPARDSAITALVAYKEILSKGACPEQARMVLPQNTMTEWIWSGTLGAFLDMLKLRLDPHTQHETRIVAGKIATSVCTLFPISYDAYLNA
ncbi:FAD-dependent thymidylate synthase [Burkholderia territorii]|uniref:FAD-dependent thymidylate synthase n=1 Tax=Burkholderia territorii TaxID=1503055 RepID=UPI0009BF52A2|nr:FAD-dependent thymidylate synthase [Burkholderia territorii]